MQPGGTGNGAGTPNESLLFHSLKDYLENKKRQQPIIGLDSVTECVKAGSCDQETLYLCEVCQSRMTRTDVRNHIMGTLHRYRYIKAQHPDLATGWGQTVDIPKLAWPLMKMATVLEQREGPGIVQVMQLDAIAFHEMGVKSAAGAISQLAAVRREQTQKKTLHQSERTQTHLESSAVQSQRVELSQKNCPVKSQNVIQCQKSNVQLKRVKVETDESVSEADATSSIKLPVEKSATPRVQLENNILDGHTVIGLDFVVECRRKEDGCSSCFLCHCCRVKSNPGDVIDHLTSSSHISNYLMEAYPECVDAMMGGLNGEKELLQSVAQRVKEIEERREHKVLEWPARRCDQLSDKTYHWCVKKFYDGESWTSAERQKKAISVNDLDALHQLTTRKEGVEVGSEQAAKKRRTGNETNPVFKVSMPMTKGAFVLERASFSLSNSPAVGTPPCPPPKTLAPNSHLDFDPLTVTVFEPPHSPRITSPPRHIEVQWADMEANIPVVIGRRNETEAGSGWGLPSQESGTEAYKKPSPSHSSCYPGQPYPENKPQYISDAPTRLIQHDPTQANYAGHPADGTGFPGSSLTEAGDMTPKTLSTRVVPVFCDHDSAKSDGHQKPAVTYYYCTPNGQRQT